MSRLFRAVQRLFFSLVVLGIWGQALPFESAQAAAQSEVTLMPVQAGECSLETLSGTYLFHGEGVLPGEEGPLPYAEAGIWTLDGAGNAVGVYSGSLNGESIASNASFNATYERVDTEGANGCAFMVLSPLGDEENVQFDLFTTPSGEMVTYFSAGFSGTMWKQGNNDKVQIEIAEEALTVDQIEPLVADIEFVSFLDLGNSEQDIFIKSDANSSGVIRVTAEDIAVAENLAKEVYSSADAVARDHANSGKNGPFPIGSALGFTLEEWFAAAATGTYTLYGSQATLSVTFENLIPNGVYSAWCGRVSFTPKMVTMDAPCGAVDGSQSVFTADDQGNATFELTMHPLTASNDDYFADLAFAYHSDGKTHGVSPGEFGKNSHVQLLLLDPVPAPVASEPIEAEVKFITHIDFGMAEQDIYIASADKPTEVVRPFEEASDADTLAQPIFAATEKVEHNPLGLGDNPLGPFPKGAEIGVTLGEWLAASGEGTYRIDGDQATLDVSFKNLIPNGIYTAWCGVITVDEEFTAADMPCGYLDGSQAQFQADADGNATYSVTMPALPMSNDHTFSDIAFAYHSDGETCGSSPCEFGLNSHVQLFIAEFPPAPTDLP